LTRKLSVSFVFFRYRCGNLIIPFMVDLYVVV
jgi:hypothetical protein